eukprot:TRINITY_DN64943_c0_g1_i1.p1 TRINITY_DN64943_c0_g1~~TRINITY_DN64943_c0_g1_i1.p1  ORF type:complete len:479 (+),score=140.36 TRINITY_DN64943_c0_g1_i1:81-1439(+)
MPVCVGIDAGGTLCKVAVFAVDDERSREVLRWLAPRLGARDVEPTMACALGNGTFHSPPAPAPGRPPGRNGSVAFASLPSGLPGLSRAVGAVAAAAHRAGSRALGSVRVAATGGLCHKHVRLFERLRRALEATGGHLMIVGEFDALVGGVNLLLLDGAAQTPRHSPFYTLSDFRFHGEVGPDRAAVRHRAVPPPRGGLLIINIGTGTSIIDLSDPRCGAHEEEEEHMDLPFPWEAGQLGQTEELPRNYRRVGGTSLGGGTFLGLCRALTGAKSFQEALSLAAQGDSTKVDMLVGDIYGTETKTGVLRSSTLASSFAKLVPKPGDEARPPPSREDLALAALVMVTMNVANIANLHARLHERTTLLFTGSFLAKDNNMARRTFAYATHFWSEGKRTAVFLESAPYVGTLGALSLVVPRHRRKKRAARGRAAAAPLPLGATMGGVAAPGKLVPRL